MNRVPHESARLRFSCILLGHLLLASLLMACGFTSPGSRGEYDRSSGSYRNVARVEPISQVAETKGFQKNIGLASFYADKFIGRQTASGEKYRSDAYTAAHRTLPFGTRLKVTRVDREISVVVRVNDRGPWKKGRIIDLSHIAARKLGLMKDGLAKVRVEVVD